MIEWLYANLSTIMISAVIAAVLVLAVLSLVRDKKKGKSITCSGSCGNCGACKGCSAVANKDNNVKTTSAK